MQSLVICTQYKYFSLSTFQSTGDEMAARSNIRYTFVIWLKAVQSFSDIFLHSNYPKKSSTSNRDSQQFTWWFFFSLLLNTSHWKTWVWATRNKVCVSTALAWRWTLRYTLCEGGRKGKGREKDGEQRVWPAKWVSRSAEWQIKCQLTERTLAPDSLAPSTAQVVFVSRVHTHARHNTLSHSKCTNALQCNLNGWLLSALNRLISAGKTILFEFDKHSWSHIVNQYSTGKQEHKSYFLGGVRIFKILCVLSSAPYMT